MKPVNADARVRQPGGRDRRKLFSSSCSGRSRSKRCRFHADGPVHGFWCALFETELEFVDEIRVDIDHMIETLGQLLVRVYLAGLRARYRTGLDQVLRQETVWQRFVLVRAHIPAQVNLDTIGRQ